TSRPPKATSTARGTPGGTASERSHRNREREPRKVAASLMRVLGAELAVVDLAKLRDYCLNDEHPRGRHKARVFAAALGLRAEHAEELREALLMAVRTYEATATEGDAYGQRYQVDFGLDRGNRRATIRSSWIVRRGESFPRLTSCYVR